MIGFIDCRCGLLLAVCLLGREERRAAVKPVTARPETLLLDVASRKIIAAVMRGSLHSWLKRCGLFSSASHLYYLSDKNEIDYDRLLLILAEHGVKKVTYHPVPIYNDFLCTKCSM